MDLYQILGEPVLRRLSADSAYTVGQWAMCSPAWFLANTHSDSNLCTDLAGIKLLNPVMSAAGFDKNCHFPTNLLRIGFGGAVGGTITLNKREGNLKPRLARLPKKALANCMGFPNNGITSTIERLKKLGNERCQFVVSIADEDVGGFLEVYREVAPYCAGVEINISSPNTTGLKKFHDKGALKELLSAIMDVAKKRVVFVKLPRFEDNTAILDLVRVVADSPAHGVILTNSKPIKNAKLSVGRGGMSGVPLYADTLQIVKDTRAEFGNALSVVACGGASSAKQVWNLLAHGANAVQLYSALVYQGPCLPNKINRDLTRAIEREGLKSISEVRDGLAWPLSGFARQNLRHAH